MNSTNSRARTDSVRPELVEGLPSEVHVLRNYGKCKLCDLDVKLVRSHIIPRSFYREFGKQEMRLYDIDGQSNVEYKQGIYGRFLCKDCEEKFQTIDNWAYKFFFQEKIQLGSDVAENGEVIKLFGFKCDSNAKQLLAKFSMSLLWRAKASGRTEFAQLVLGDYELDFKSAIRDDVFSDDLERKLSLSGWLYSGSKNMAFDIASAPLTPYQSKSKIDGKYKSWAFGFPFGLLILKVGGDNPAGGYFNFTDGRSSNLGVQWSSNLSDKYTFLFFPESPRESSDPAVINYRNKYAQKNQSKNDSKNYLVNPSTSSGRTDAV